MSDVQVAQDAMLESCLPVECGENGSYVIALLVALRELHRFHAALSYAFIHCYFIKVIDVLCQGISCWGLCVHVSVMHTVCVNVWMCG